MNRRLVLLFTRAPNFQKLLPELLLKENLNVLVTRSVNHVLQTVCARSGDLKFVVIARARGFALELPAVALIFSWRLRCDDCHALVTKLLVHGA